MYKLLIVDDEKIIRETISNIIDWTAHDIQVVGVCKDGLEAVDCIMDESPDIVLTDIRMPGLSGLDLIEKIKDTNPNTQFIILSGYGEFELAQRAMKYGVKHYLLKPTNENDILDTVQKVIADLPPATSTSSQHSKKKDDCIAQTIDYIKDHIADTDLSLKWISENVLFMNPDYLSKQFLKTTGQKFSAYLTSLRVEQAQHLLTDGTYDSIYDVAVQVGFGNNPQYFSQIFKKYTGLTPNNYLKAQKKS